MDASLNLKIDEHLMDHDYCKSEDFSGIINYKSANQVEREYGGESTKVMANSQKEQISEKAEDICLDYDDETESLIDFVRGYPCLYDKQCKDAKDKGMKETAWQEIGNILQEHPESIKSKWESLREKFVREKRLRDRETRSGSGLSTRNKFPYFNQMSFIEIFIRKRKSSSNFSSEKAVPDTMNKRSVNNLNLLTPQEDDEPSSAKKSKKPSENKSTELENYIVSLSKTVESHLKNQGKSSQKSASNNRITAFADYLIIQMEALTESQQLKLQSEINALVSKAILNNLENPQ